MKRNRQKSLLVFLIMAGFLMGLLYITTGCERPAAEKIDKRLIGTWSRATINAAHGITFRPDNTFRELFIFDFPQFRTRWFKRYTGKYRIDGNKIIFYEVKSSSSRVDGVVKYTSGEYEVLEQIYKEYEVNYPVADYSRSFQIIDSDTIKFVDYELKRAGK